MRGRVGGSNMMSNPVERLTAEWQLAPAAALSDLPYTGMAIMRWTCRTALKREVVSEVGDDVHVFSYVLRNSRATSWLDGRQVWDGVIPAHGLRILAPGRASAWALAAADSDIVLVDLLGREMERAASEIRDAGRRAMM